MYPNEVLLTVLHFPSCILFQCLMFSSCLTRRSTSCLTMSSNSSRRGRENCRQPYSSFSLVPQNRRVSTSSSILAKAGGAGEPKC